jgi:hypothetical protein
VGHGHAQRGQVGVALGQHDQQTIPQRAHAQDVGRVADHAPGERVGAVTHRVAQPERAWSDLGQDVVGEQRLCLRVGVAREVTAVTITYAHFTELGQVPIPRIDVRPSEG